MLLLLLLLLFLLPRTAGHGYNISYIPFSAPHSPPREALIQPLSHISL